MIDSSSHDCPGSDWYPFEDGQTLGERGSDGGVILRDEEHSAGCRITLERDSALGPFSITCGIYGLMVHTASAGSAPEADDRYEAMRAQLAELALIEGDQHEALWAFVDRFP